MPDLYAMKNRADFILRQGGADTRGLAEIVKELCEECEDLKKRLGEVAEVARKARRDARKAE